MKRKRQPTAWNPLFLECEFENLNLRVVATRSPNRWKWFVSKRSEIIKAPVWWDGDIGKGSSRALAVGFSFDREKACSDAIAMAKVILDNRPA